MFVSCLFNDLAMAMTVMPLFLLVSDPARRLCLRLPLLCGLV